ncbi:MAG: hypothetical protein KIS96_01250 [Bauldia sp.]|nr:hypothetical protein [Bauldia sp.]
MIELSRSSQSPVADARGNVHFAMTDGRRDYSCRVSRSYLRVLTGEDGRTTSSDLFARVRNLVEEAVRVRVDFGLCCDDGLTVQR